MLSTEECTGELLSIEPNLRAFEHMLSTELKQKETKREHMLSSDRNVSTASAGGAARGYTCDQYMHSQY